MADNDDDFGEFEDFGDFSSPTEVQGEETNAEIGVPPSAASSHSTASQGTTLIQREASSSDSDLTLSALTGSEYLHAVVQLWAPLQSGPLSEQLLKYGGEPARVELNAYSKRCWQLAEGAVPDLPSASMSTSPSGTASTLARPGTGSIEGVHLLQELGLAEVAKRAQLQGRAQEDTRGDIQGEGPGLSALTVRPQVP